MKINEEKAKAIEGWKYDLTDSKEAYKYEIVTKKVGEYVGKEFGKDMRSLVISNIELEIKKPTYPTGNNLTDEMKAIWSKEYDRYLKLKDK